MPQPKPAKKAAAKSNPTRKSWVSLVTVALEIAAEGLRMAGEIAKAKRVEAILAGRPRLDRAESAAFRRAVERLGR